MVRSNATVRDPRHPAHEPPSYQLGHGSRCQAKLAPTLSSPPYSTYSEGIHPQTSWRPSARCSAPDVVQFQSSAFLFSVLIPVDHVCNSKFTHSMDILHCGTLDSNEVGFQDAKFCFVAISSKLVQGRAHAPRSLVADLLLGVDMGYAANRSGLLLVPKGSICVTRFASFF